MTLVSDLVVGAISASAKSIAEHYKSVFSRFAPAPELEPALCAEILRGYTHDVDDNVLRPDAFGFSHSHTTRIFYQCLRPVFLQRRTSPRAGRTSGASTRGVDSHIWAQDYDRRLRSLLPTGKAKSRFEDGATLSNPSSINERSRASALIQHAILRSRFGLHQIPSGSDEGSISLFLPSPFYAAYLLLTDPDLPGSEVSAGAALRAEVKMRLQAVSGPLRIDYNSISQALQTLENRVSTSKAVLDQDPVLRLICHVLAMRGQLNMELTLGEDDNRVGALRALARWVDASQIAVPSPPRLLGFRLHPSVERLPDAGELLNELEGLPLPIEGGRIVFQGGIRFAAGGDLVAAVSGPYGAGKTSACLSLAASLAPLGFRTLYLTCEEEPADIETRMQEAAPASVRSQTPLFKCVSLEELQDPTLQDRWFNAYALRLEDNGATEDLMNDLGSILADALSKAPLFEAYPANRADNEDYGLPQFARPIVIVDGLHQLFRERRESDASFERGLRLLIDRCRALNAVFIFTVAEQAAESIRLDYLCDLVIQLDRQGYDEPNGAPSRLLKLLKARRQPARMGAHPFYLSSPKGFRIKPNVSARAESAKNQRWFEPDSSLRIYLRPRSEDLSIVQGAQVLLYGQGSSGKAGLGMLILHTRPQRAAESGLRHRASQRKSELLWEENSSAGDGVGEAGSSERRPLSLLYPSQPPYYESRTLAVSFLYPPSYYRAIARKLGTSRVAPRGRVYHEGVDRPVKRDSALPDRYTVDVISCYPGHLRVEELLSKIENALDAAELRGLPYTGVLVDGLHNVFVQFPELEKAELFWPQLYDLLRRRRVTVVTTHTQISLPQPTSGSVERNIFNDFEHARRQAAPLLSALISSADYVFELTVVEGDLTSQTRLTMRSGLEGVKPGYSEWHREDLKIGSSQPHLFGRA